MEEENEPFSVDFDFDFDFDFDIEEDTDKRYRKPKKIKAIPSRFVIYNNAEKLAEDIDIEPNFRYFCVISGNFVFGDFLEAFAVKKNLIFRSITLSTLSLSENNVDSLANLINWKYCKDLNIVVSDYFWGHERTNLIPYMYQKLDIDDRFQLAVARTHTKIALMETWEGRKFVVHGSANLRSSDNVEAFCIEENSDLFDFNFQWHSEIIREYSTINKSVKTKKLWQLLGGRGSKGGKAGAGKKSPAATRTAPAGAPSLQNALF